MLRISLKNDLLIVFFQNGFLRGVMIIKMDNEIISKIADEYDKLNAKNRRERDARVADVYSRFPEIEKIDKEISVIGSSTLKNIMKNPDKKELKEEMLVKFDILKQKKREILKANNIPEDFSQIRYSCNICKDTGHVEGASRCSCFRQKAINYLYKSSNMSELLKKQNFNSFNMDYYSRKKEKGMELSPYENMVNIKKYCENYVNNFDNISKSLVFYGDTGLGKTFMSSCIAKALMDKGNTVIYVRASRLFKMFDDEKFGRISDGMEDVYSADLLIIDDLGTEAVYKNNNSYLLDLINERINSDKKIIINTNLDFRNLEDRYTKRFSSRLLDDFTMMYFYGEDIRRQKLFKR